MTVIFQPDYQWAAGFNNVAGFVTVQSDVPSYQNKPMIIQSRGRFVDGELFERADGVIVTLGESGFSWLIPVMGITQYAYIRAKSPGGTGYYVKQTVRTRNSLDAFANYSAILHIPRPSDLERRSDVYRNVVLRWIVEAAL